MQDEYFYAVFEELKRTRNDILSVAAQKQKLDKMDEMYELLSTLRKAAEKSEYILNQTHEDIAKQLAKNAVQNAIKYSTKETAMAIITALAALVICASISFYAGTTVQYNQDTTSINKTIVDSYWRGFNDAMAIGKKHK